MKAIILVLALLPQFAFTSENEVIGGRPVRDGEFPMSVRIRSGNASCSASIAGPRVLITAAHCTKADGEIVPLSETLEYEFQLGQHFYSAVCKIAPEYRGQQYDQDMALCKSDREMVGIPYAEVSQSPLVVGDKVQIVAYGCTQPGGGGGNDGVLRVGEVGVTELPSDQNFSFATQGAAAACFGDSGGPVFVSGSFVQAGVVSRGNIRDYSLLTALYHPRSISFMKAYEQAQGVKICGLGMDCGHSKPKDCGQEMLDLKSAVKKLDACLASR